MPRISIARIALFIAICLGIAPFAAHAGNVCPADATKAIAEAKAALAAEDPKQDRHALMCLVQAVQALDATLDGMRNGSVRFAAPLPLAKTKADAHGRAEAK